MPSPLRAALSAAALAGLCATTHAADELELYHADFHARIGQRIHVQIGRADGDARLTATLTSDKGHRAVLLDKAGPLANEEVFTLIQRDLPAAAYTLTVTLSKGGRTIRQAVRTFAKPYDGVPKVGIDEHNALCVDGKPFYPVTTWGLSAADMPQWAKAGYVNALCHVAFGDETFGIDWWKKYLDAAAASNVKVIGPLRGDYWPNGGWSRIYKDANGQTVHQMQLNTERIAQFVNATKDHPALLAWSWHDEPDLGGRNAYIPATEVRKWTDVCHKLDPHHPVFINVSGYMFTGAPGRDHGRQLAKSYSYLTGIQKSPPMGDSAPFERRTLIADVLSFDYYPYEYRSKFDWVSLEDFATALDNLRAWNHDLVPYFSCVETCDLRAKPSDRPPTPAITADQLWNLCWLNVVHGVKGVVWFHHFEPTPEDNYRTMARFVDWTTALAPAILGAPYQGKVEASAPQGRRVDVTARQHQGKVYLFAVHVPRGHEFASPADDKPVRASFRVPGLPGKAAVEVHGEGRTIIASDGSFQDELGPYGVAVYVMPSPK